MEIVNKRMVFDPDKLKDLEIACNKAIKSNNKSFIFEDNEYLTTYTKYLLEYLTKQSIKKQEEKSPLIMEI